MRIINNVSDLLGDDLKAEIKPGSKVRIAASTFSIFAFGALGGFAVVGVEKIEFLLVAIDKPSQELPSGPGTKVRHP